MRANALQKHDTLAQRLRKSMRAVYLVGLWAGLVRVMVTRKKVQLGVARLALARRVPVLVYDLH